MSRKKQVSKGKIQEGSKGNSRRMFGIALAVPVVIAALVAGIVIGPSGLGHLSSLGLTRLNILGPAVPNLAQVEGETPSLDERCTISILNRTARVQPDGSWSIPNVPATLGQVRARATCVFDGVTVSGQSDFFDILPNVVNGFNADIPLGVVDPIPDFLTITPQTVETDETGNSLLSAPGQTNQLTVVATFPDTSTKDVTASAEGTNYTSSNPAIATVSQEGLVTAASSGTVLISALNEGALGLMTFRLILSADADEDGIPDDLELANGLDPNNAVDALEDFDIDGLTNREELLDFGTGIRNSDTDGDGILDGEEVVLGDDGFVTNPLLADTDGDQITDALEVQIGTDPTDPGDFAAALDLALDFLDVTPSAVILTVNLITGQSSRQLAVTGNLIDGSTIDLTSTTTGTNYVSSDLLICNFGAPDGRVFAGNNGSCDVTVSNSGIEAIVPVTVTTFTPTPLSSVAIPGFANNVDVSGDIAYVAAGATGLQVVDVSDRGAPVIIGSGDTPGNANDVKVIGNFALVADGSAGLQVFDISNPANPVIIGTVDTPGNARDVVVKGPHAYVADGAAGLQVIDISNRTAPVIVGSVNTPGAGKGVDVHQTLPFAVVADGSNGIQVVDITDPTNPVLRGQVAIGDSRDVAIDTDFVFVADYNNSFTSVDITNLDNPVVRDNTSLNFGGRLNDVVRRDRFGFGADVQFFNGVPIIDVALPAALAPQFILDFRQFGDGDGHGIAVDDQFVYMTASKSAHAVENGINGNSRLYIGQYRALADNEGIPPKVSITFPAPGAEIREGTPLLVEIDAQDDIAVAAVRLRLNGGLVGTDTTAPYQIPITTPLIPNGVFTFTLVATATDIGGNEGSSAPVIIDLLPDAPPTVAITDPADGDEVLEGSVLAVNVDANDDVAVTKVDLFVDGALVGTDTEAPFTFQADVPLLAVEFPDGRDLEVRAEATDSAGRTTTDAITLMLIPDPPPTVAITSPQDGDTVVEGETLTFSANAADNIGVARVDFITDGVFATDATAPYSVQVVVPTGVLSLNMQATATDNVGGTNSDSIEVDVIPDPLTTVDGQVVDEAGISLPGFNVRTFGIAAVTDESGEFLIPGVPTILGDIAVAVEGEINGDLAFGRSLPVPPDRGGITSVGQIEIVVGRVLFGVNPESVGVPGSGLEAAAVSLFIEEVVTQVAASIYEEVPGNTNVLLLEADDLGLRRSDITGLVVQGDGTLLFSVVDARGVHGSGVEQRLDSGLREADIFRSAGDGTNELFLAGDALGLLPFTGTQVDAIAEMPDGSFLFSVNPAASGVEGSAVAAEPEATRGMAIFQSTGNGTNQRFLAAADLGLLTGNVDALVRQADDSLLFSVAPGTTGAPGSAVEAASGSPSLDSDVFSTAGDGTNELFRAMAEIGIDHGGIDALESDPDQGTLLFSVDPATAGIELSGIEAARQSIVLTPVSQVATSTFQAIADGSNQLVFDGLELGILPGVRNVFFDEEVGEGGGVGAPEQASSAGSGEPDAREHELVGDGNISSLALLEDGSVLFNVRGKTVGVEGSGVDDREGSGCRKLDIYRSRRDGTNELFIACGLLGMDGGRVDAIALLPDGSVLFSTNDRADGNGAVGDAPRETRGMNIYRSFRDGTNELYRSAEQLGLLPTRGNVDALVWNPDGTILFSVDDDTEGVPGSAVAAANEETVDSDVFLTRSDGTNQLLLAQNQLGILLGGRFYSSGTGVDALALRPAPTIDGLGIPPTVMVESPLPGEEFIEGISFDVQVTSSDDVVVASVDILIGGEVLATTTFPNALTAFTGLVIPDGVGLLEITARATDLGGNAATDVVVVDVIPDPLTTVIGIVTDANGTALEGATATVFGDFTVQTDAGGAFQIDGVPTVRGDIVVGATGIVNGEPAFGSSDPFPPVPGGVTDVGQITIEEKRAIALVNSDSLSLSVKSVLVATGLFEADDISIIDTLLSTPTLDDLSEFRAVLVWTNNKPQNPDLLGNVLADYVDQGGGVVLATYAFSQPWRVGGRMMDITAGMSPFAVSNARFRTSGTLDLANSDTNHPVLSGVNSASYFVNSNYTNPALTQGASLIAQDTGGNRLIAVNATDSVVGVSIFPGFGLVGDAGLIYANALRFVGVGPVIEGSISGSVVEVGGGTPVVGAVVTAKDFGTGEAAGTAVTDDDGNYAIGGLQSGDYEVEANAADQGFVPQCFQDDDRCQAPTPVAVIFGVNTRNIDFFLLVGGGIAGRVTDEISGAPIAGYRVRADLLDGGGNVVSSFTGFSDAEGFYDISLIPPGDYKVEADQAPEADQHIDEFFDDKATLEDADVVAVGAGEAVGGINFPLALPPVPPHVFAGSATLDGQLVADGTQVVAFILGSEVGTAATEGGTYALGITQPPGKDFADQIVSFTVAGIAADQTGVWEAGGATELNLTATTQ